MMEKGDIVAVLLSGKLPFLLWKDEEHYGFLGPCLFDALSSSGWVDEQVRLEKKLKSFTLRCDLRPGACVTENCPARSGLQTYRRSNLFHHHLLGSFQLSEPILLFVLCDCC